MRSLFVTAIDTEVGKTVIASGLMKALGAHYWKPVATGDADDTAEARRLTGLDECYFLSSAYRFRANLSPHLAARLEKRKLDPGEILRVYREHAGKRLVVEGIGGLLVPLCENFLLADLARALELPVVIVSVDRLGAINQTLLTISACRERGIPIAGIVWNRVTGEFGNRESVEEFSGVPTLFEVPETSDPKLAVDHIAKVYR